MRSWWWLPLLLGGCSQQEADSELVPAPRGCALTSSAVDGVDCRVQWNCSEGGQHVLFCAGLEDGGVACRCDLGEEQGALMNVDQGCGEAPYEARASEVCGWSLQ